jgi:ABC-type branched-subunit amino acid transport system substrate-binding protein
MTQFLLGRRRDRELAEDGHGHGHEEGSPVLERLFTTLIGPFTLFSADPYALNEFTFYLFSGFTEQVRVLVDFAARDLKLENPRIAVLGPGDNLQKDLQAAITAQGEVHGWTGVAGFSILPDSFKPEAAAMALKEQGVDCLFYLSFRGLKTLLEAADRVDWRPHVFLPGALVEKEMLELPAGFQNRIYLSYPTLPSDQTPAGISEFRTLLEKHELPVKNLTSQISAYVAAKILVEGLKRTGRDLSREKFIHSLENFYQFQTGLTPRLTYGPNRRIGALGSHIVTIDLEKKNFAPVGGWIDISDRG